ncbi:MAG: hypothetical protein KJO13_07270, partial [Gammaproteobacteria bacterium]|nr:hypothetical protein [Gammaproteobacteria bacterium]
MPTKRDDPSIRRGDLGRERLYVGKHDAELDHYTTKFGQVATASIGDLTKNGPNEDSAAIIPVNDNYMVLIVADGVGGIVGGRKASNLTIET